LSHRVIDSLKRAHLALPEKRQLNAGMAR